MKPLYICTMVFNRHDLLTRMLRSVVTSTLQPDGVFIVDHAYDERKFNAAVEASGWKGLVQRIVLDDPGCAHAANHLIRMVPDDRLGCGDDIVFHPDAIRIMANTEGDFVIPDPECHVNPAACAIIRDSCIKKVGPFDEKISPGYLYFEDTDFIRRMALAGVPITTCAAKVEHGIDGQGSQTLKKYTSAQMAEHHMRFRVASANYQKKWGGEPFQETLTVPVEL